MLYENGSKTSIEGSSFSFRLRESMKRGRLVESYEPTAAKGGVPALRVETRDPGERRERDPLLRRRS